MGELGFNVVIKEGDTGQFELFRQIYLYGDREKIRESSDYWTSYMKEGNGIPKFFTLRDVELKLSGHSPKN